MATAKDIIRLNCGMADYIFHAYLGDLTDDDLLIAPVPGTNPIAWQLGHLIAGEWHFLNTIKPGSSPDLPEGFAAAHDKETAAPNPFRKFCSKADYVSAWEAQHAATSSVLDALPDEELDAPSGIEYAPTKGALLNLIGAHALGHLGQFVAVRRKLGKPVVF